MTIAEFKAWLEGFTDNMDGPPDAEQWGKIQEKMARLSEIPLFPSVPNRPGRIDDRTQPYTPLGPIWTCGNTMAA